MNSHNESLETLTRVITLSEKWQSNIDIGEVNKDSIEAHNKLKRLGLVYAVFSRSRRVEDFHTLPRDQAKTSVFDLEDGTTLELQVGTRLLVCEAPIFIEVFTETPVLKHVLVQYCLAQLDDDPFIARRRVFTQAPQISFIPETHQ